MNKYLEYRKKIRQKISDISLKEKEMCFVSGVL